MNAVEMLFEANKFQFAITFLVMWW